METTLHPALLAFLPGSVLPWAAVGFGLVFGFLLHKGGVTSYNVIVNQFRFRDFTVLKIMLTAIVVGGIGVWILKGQGLCNHHIKPADMLAVLLGAVLFGIGMAVYGYCPGTGVAAAAAGRLDALAGLAGMVAGGAAYALAYPWIKDHILTVAAWGKIRLPDVTGIPDPVWFGLLLVIALVVFRLIPRWEKPEAE